MASSTAVNAVLTVRNRWNGAVVVEVVWRADDASAPASSSGLIVVAGNDTSTFTVPLTGLDVGGQFTIVSRWGTSGNDVILTNRSYTLSSATEDHPVSLTLSRVTLVPDWLVVVAVVVCVLLLLVGAMFLWRSLAARSAAPAVARAAAAAYPQADTLSPLLT